MSMALARREGDAGYCVSGVFRGGGVRFTETHAAEGEGGGGVSSTDI